MPFVFIVQHIQESIPVGCVLPTCQPYPMVSPLDIHIPTPFGQTHPPLPHPTEGTWYQRYPPPGGYMGPDIPIPPPGQTNICEYIYLPATSLAGGKQTVDTCEEGHPSPGSAKDGLSFM